MPAQDCDAPLTVDYRDKSPRLPQPLANLPRSGIGLGWFGGRVAHGRDLRLPQSDLYIQLMSLTRNAVGQPDEEFKTLVQLGYCLGRSRTSHWVTRRTEPITDCLLRCA